MPDAVQRWQSPALALVLILIALRRRVSRVSCIAVQRYPMLLSACALALWRWLWDRYRLIAADGPPLPTLPTPSEEEVSSPPLQRCNNSFTITNERGESRGSLNEKATGGWSWQVDESPVTASIGPQKPPGPVLRRDGGEAEAEAQAQARLPSAQAPRGAAAATPAQPVADSPWRRARRSSRVTFQLDQSPGFYGFVFSYDGTCVAHGADDSFVGLSLKQERPTYYLLRLHLLRLHLPRLHLPRLYLLRCTHYGCTHCGYTHYGCAPSRWSSGRTWRRAMAPSRARSCTAASWPRQRRAAAG